MIEPTESESKEEIDRFADSMIQIRAEIRKVEEGVYGGESNILKNAPHTANVVVSDTWNYNYSRETAAFPLAWIKEQKYWPTVGRVDDAYGDRNLICSCPSVEEYMNEVV